MKARDLSLWTSMGAAVASCVVGLAMSAIPATSATSATSLPATGEDCPIDPPATLSPNVPSDVCIPSTFQGNAIKYFDDFSWRSFAALVWPAKSGSRGMPDPAQRIVGPGARVFETYKSPWEVFHDDGAPPLDWSIYDNRNACNVNPGFGGLVLASYSKFSELGQAGIGSLVGPLIAQNRTYVRFLTGMNQIEFEQIAKDQLYLRKNLPDPAKKQILTFRNGALDVKSAWVDMAGIPNPERYYTKVAWVLDSVSALKQQGSVWQYYQLVMTQWPLDRAKPEVPGTPGNTFPGNREAGDDATAFANLTMETFDQKVVGRGCMACHTFTKDATDFLWVLKDHAYPPTVPNARRNDAALRALDALLKNAEPPKPESH